MLRQKLLSDVIQAHLKHSLFSMKGNVDIKLLKIGLKKFPERLSLKFAKIKPALVPLRTFIWNKLASSSDLC